MLKVVSFLDDIFEDLLADTKRPTTGDTLSSDDIKSIGKSPKGKGALVEEMMPGTLSKVHIYNGESCVVHYLKIFDKKRKPRKGYIDSLKSSDEHINISTSFNGLLFRNNRSVSWQVKTDSCPEEKTSKIIISKELIDRELELPKWLKEGDYGVVKETFERHPHWKNTLIVMDVTGSMSPYIAKTMAWVRETQSSDLVEAFTFFNDGDMKPTKFKRVGMVGGVYSVENDDFATVYAKMKHTMRKGGGGDCPENNVEAILSTIQEYPDYDEIVMVADNFATPRDLSITEKVDKPVHLILCGANFGVNLDNIQLAYDTGGSVHTIEEDMDMRSIKPGAKFKIGNTYFTLSKGRIVKAKNR